ncbi:MAG: hypothetical protein WC994_02055 [Brumimicrobium sp.]
MKFVDSSQINKNLWDEIVAFSEKNNVTSYSWYLDATTKKWGAILTEDYSFILPLPYKNRFLYKRIFQHPFSRNLEFFGDTSMLDEAIELLKSKSKFSFHFNHKVALLGKKKIYQKLDLNKKIEYKTNTQRILRKYKADFSLQISNNYQSVLSFYFNNSFNKIKQQKKNKILIKQAMEAALNHDKGQVIEVFDKNKKLVAAGFFLFDKKTVYYLIGDAPLKEKKRGVMFVLMDFAIQTFKNDYDYFDFGGSNVESVATFYRKLGGKDVEYFEYSNL